MQRSPSQRTWRKDTADAPSSEYLQFLYIAKGSLAESLARSIGLSRVNLISQQQLDAFDKLHYEVENKLLSLISSLETKRGTNDWQSMLPINPTIHKSINPSIHQSTVLR